MAQPQAGILPEPSPFALFLILQVRGPATNAASVAKNLSGVPALADRVRRLDPKSNLTCTVAFGSEFWDAVSPRKRSARLHPFKTIAANGRTAPNTGGDILLHTISKRHDLNFELALRVRRGLADVVELKDEVHGFRYLDMRDLTGFIDGTENPKGKERAKVALITDEDPQFAGGSYVYTQRYVHDLKLWGTVPRREQEKIVGRRITDSQELSARLKPPAAHISRVVIEEDGAELEIVRHSFPYGTTSEAGCFSLPTPKTWTLQTRC